MNHHQAGRLIIHPNERPNILLIVLKGKSWETGQASGWILPTFMKKKKERGGEKSCLLLSKYGWGWTWGWSLCWFIPRAQHSLQGLRLQQDNHIRVLHLYSDSTLVLQTSYPLPQVLQTSYPLPGSGKCRCGAVGRACSPTPVGPAPQTTRACSTSIFPHAAAASTWSRIPLPSLQLQD